ncbi:hypothetical protein LXL04_008203 [Taraxacum kok-saghyz]
MSSSTTSLNVRRCSCGDVAGFWTSWTIKNPRRRFFGCPNFMDDERDCGYFRWVDPPLPNKWYKDHMFNLGVILNRPNNFPEPRLKMWSYLLLKLQSGNGWWFVFCVY